MESLVSANAEFFAGHENPSRVMVLFELEGRICHASEDKIGPGTANKFVGMLIKLGHESVLEHHSVTVKVTCDRATSHQWVRHRLGSYTQMSQRYVDHATHDCQFIDPEFRSASNGKRYNVHTINDGNEKIPEDVLTLYRIYYSTCMQSLEAYENLRQAGAAPEDARSVLPNGAVTTFYVTFNIRQWRHFLNERCNPAAQHLIRRIALGLLVDFYKILPACFGDIYQKFNIETDHAIVPDH